MKECVVHYECLTLRRLDLVPDAIAEAVREEFGAAGDFHRVYFGQIVAVYGVEDPANACPPAAER